jgi:hypothetical protein
MNRWIGLLLIASIAGPVPAARAADPAISAAETSVWLGLTGGYGNDQGQDGSQMSESGALLGISTGISALTPSGLARYGLPDLYTEVEYGFAAGFLNEHGNLNGPAASPYEAHDDAYYNTAIVRLGIGAPVDGGREVIPYVAGGYQSWNRSTAGNGEYDQAGLIGGGLRFDVVSTPLLILSAQAEGLAVIGGETSVPSRNFSGSFGTGAQERVALDADYRLHGTWHAYAGLGVTHYGEGGERLGAKLSEAPLSSALQVDSMFGVAYGF